MKSLETILNEYRSFLSEVSEEAGRLEEIYRNHMVCRKGCSACCTDLSLLPLEWYVLRRSLRESDPSMAPLKEEGRCSLLEQDACRLYPSRPLICRTHGLPLLYLMEEYDASGARTGLDDPEWQISWCDLNFTEVDEDSMEEVFDPEDVLNMEYWNQQLKELNREFLETGEGLPFRGKARFSLEEIFSSDDPGEVPSVIS